VTSGPLDLRVSDADRERVAQRLRHAAGEGRLTLEELDERVEAAYVAKTGADLAPLTADLPETGAPSTALTPAPDPKRARRRRWALSIMGGGDLRGRWRAGDSLRAVAIMGGGDIDLRETVFDEPEMTITAVAIMGGIDVIVPAGVEVEISGLAIMGGNESRVTAQNLPPHAPRVHVRAFSLMGGVCAKLKRADRKALEGSADR
jgi:hypothetical protein